MSALGDADHRLVLEALTPLALEVDNGDLGRCIMRVVRSVIDCDVAALNDVDPSRDQAVFVSEPAAFPAPDEAPGVLAELVAQHPLVQYVQRTGDRSARRISDVVSAETFHASALYQRLYRPMGVEHQMVLTLDVRSPAVVAVSISRGATDFTDRERDLLNLLAPHLAAAWRQSSTIARLGARLSAAQSPGTANARAIVVSEPVRELTEGTLTELGRFFGPPTRTGLSGQVEAWLATDSRSLVGFADNAHALLRRLPAEPGEPAVLLFYGDGGWPPARSPSADLTARESEVLSLLAIGHTNAEVAGELHIAAGTVKKHLDNIYAKLGVRGRLRAVTLALELGLVVPGAFSAPS